MDTYYAIARPIYPFKIKGFHFTFDLFKSNFIPDETHGFLMELKNEISPTEFVRASRTDEALLFKTEQDAKLYAQANKIYHRIAFDDFSQCPVFQTTFKAEAPSLEFKPIEITLGNSVAQIKHTIECAKVNNNLLSYQEGNLTISDAAGRDLKTYHADGRYLTFRDFPAGEYIARNYRGG